MLTYAMLTYANGEIALSVKVDRWEADAPSHGRYRIAYRVEIADGGDPIIGDDLRTGTIPAGHSPNLGEMLATLAHFLAHDAERYACHMGEEPADGWSWDAVTAERLYVVGADELAMIAEEIHANA